MRVVKLSENLYEIKLPFWYWTPKKPLIDGFKVIQGYGKVITCVIHSGFDTYIVLTN